LEQAVFDAVVPVECDAGCVDVESCVALVDVSLDAEAADPARLDRLEDPPLCELCAFAGQCRDCDGLAAHTVVPVGGTLRLL
jgi:hypothetical protein